ncbi:MAG: DUF3833 domain-containing protein [uncultured Campylobacterales bacterium]|uniref:DUF3833 domain-containing protein n=1 Tax=uncultured Campylobacterales bacterium TaxID=352960 RepID=A0A6S6T4U1_9BACT|nr:MAG: DUF3833 domain-containing protein [uncultured Campylobacterales bacterium]
MKYIVLITILIFTGCSMKLEDFKNTTPKFIPKVHLNGTIKAYGLIKSRSGKITRRFEADMIGSWEENGSGELKENFIYDDGEKEQRIWKLTPNKDGSYNATANDIVGVGVMKVEGNSLFIDYVLRITYNEKPLDVRIKDWLHLQNDGVILNNSDITKWGFKVGEIVATMIKTPFKPKDILRKEVNK